ncbi:hypothetical protein LOTGIDRAFT_142077, partial [Lottia gigantea]
FRPDKLLLTVGIKGSGDGDFCYPRDLITTDEGDVIIADTNNHRIQVINQFGVFRYKFGKKGSRDGEFNEPTGVSQLPNNYLVVADSKNKRIQIFTPKGVFKSSFATKPDEIGAVFAISIGPEGHLVASEFSLAGEHCIKMFRYSPCECHANRPPSSKRRTPIT